MNKASAGKHYQAINAQTGVVDADPHRLIQMLFVGALDQISVAKGCMQRSDLAGKGAAIIKAVDIVGGLRDSVNPDAGDAALTENLAALYEFASRRLTEANLNNDEAALDEAANVLRQLQAGWDDIRSEALSQFKSGETQPA